MINQAQQIEIIFRHSADLYPPIAARWNIRDNSLAKRWTQLLVKNIMRGDHPLEKDYCLNGWQNTWYSEYDRNLELLCKLLNQAILQINTSSLNYRIDLEFSVEKLRSNQYRTLMNDLHHHFELLIGQLWNPSDWYSQADEPTRQSIRQLNNLCHEIEQAVESIKGKLRGNILSFFRMGTRPASVSVSQNGKDFQGNFIKNRTKWDITEKEFEYFEYGDAWGDIELYYSQLGKTHKDAWLDDDTFIEESNISSTQFITGEFVINFYPLFKRGTKLPQQFCKWLTRHGFNIERRFGSAVVAEIDIHSIKEKKRYMKELIKRDDLFQIALLDKNGNALIKKQFDYTWKDQV